MEYNVMLVGWNNHEKILRKVENELKNLFSLFLLIRDPEWIKEHFFRWNPEIERIYNDLVDTHQVPIFAALNHLSQFSLNVEVSYSATQKIQKSRDLTNDDEFFLHSYARSLLPFVDDLTYPTKLNEWEILEVSYRKRTIFILPFCVNDNIFMIFDPYIFIDYIKTSTTLIETELNHALDKLVNISKFREILNVQIRFLSKRCHKIARQHKFNPQYQINIDIL